jgi:quinol monooxygenase YgiN
MITQIVKFYVKPEHREAFKAALLEDKKNAEQEAGCVEMRMFADNKNPDLIFSYERWKDQDALDYHREHPYTVKICQLVDTALQSPLEVLNLGETEPPKMPVSGQNTPNPEDDVFVVFFIFKIKEGYRERLLEQFEKHVAHTRREPGNLLFDLYTVAGSDDSLAVYEHWRNESAVWDIHFKQPYTVETGALIKEAVAGGMKQYINFVTEIA